MRGKRGTQRDTDRVRGKCDRTGTGISFVSFNTIFSGEVKGFWGTILIF